MNVLLIFYSGYGGLSNKNDHKRSKVSNLGYHAGLFELVHSNYSELAMLSKTIISELKPVVSDLQPESMTDDWLLNYHVFCMFTLEGSLYKPLKIEVSYSTCNNDVVEYITENYKLIVNCKSPSNNLIPSPNSEIESSQLKILNQAYKELWSQSIPSDKTTHPQSKEVIAWLISHGIPDHIAQKLPPILQPDWKK